MCMPRAWYALCGKSYVRNLYDHVYHCTCATFAFMGLSFAVELQLYNCWHLYQEVMGFLLWGMP